MTVLDAGAGTGFTTEGIVERVDAARRDDARPEPAPVGAQPVQAGAGGRARACSATPRTCRSPTTASTATSPPARSSTGPTRSAGIAEAYRVTRAGRHRAGDRPGAPGQPRRPRAGRDLDAVPGGRGVHAAGWRPPASRTCACASSRRTGTATGARRTRWRSAASSPRPGPSPAARAAPVAEEPVEPRALRRPLRGRLRRGRRVHPDRRRADAARPRRGARGARGVSLPPRPHAHAARRTRSLVLWRFGAAAHAHRHGALGRRPLPDRRGRGRRGRRRRRPAGHADRRPDRQHRDRRRQPDHRRRDRPDQQAVAADRRGRPLARRGARRSSPPAR